MSDNDADALNATITTGMIMNFIVLFGGDCLRSFMVGFLEVAIIPFAVNVNRMIFFVFELTC